MRWHVLLLAFTLAAIGLGTAWYKADVLGYPLRASDTTDAWVVEARASFQPLGGGVKATLLLPRQPPGFQILDENFISRGYGLAMESIDGNRAAVWTQRRPSGQQALYYRATLLHDRGGEDDAPPPPLPAVPDYGEPYGQAVNAILDQARSRSADIVTFSSVLVQMLNSPGENDNVTLMLPRNAGDTDKVRTAIYMLAGARIPARMVRGITLADGARDLRPTAWLEVHNSRRWVPINPNTGSTGYPENFLPWWHGDADPFEVSRAQGASLQFSATRNAFGALDTALQRSRISESRLYEFSLLNLPIQTQNLYRVLLLIPVGVLIIVVLRNVVGLQTFGTFMPVLIALSFRETELVGGLVLFTVIVALGLLIRFYLDRLKLLLVPRLASVVIIVILLMAVLSVVSNQLDLEVGLSVALFPMVILAMTIERMSIVWEEHGPGDAIRQGLGSLAVAVVCYLLMFNRGMEHLVLVFPELLLLVLAVALLMGRYSGYRLTELVRFREMGR